MDNPFYNYLTPTLFPGPLRNQKTVSLSSLLTKYPQYGGLYEVGTQGASERYSLDGTEGAEDLQQGLELPRRIRLHSREDQRWPSTNSTRYQNNLTYQNSNQPRHRFTMAGTYELPFGKGKPYMSNANAVTDAILGGWKVTGISTYFTGAILRFGKMNYNGQEVTVSTILRRSKWFNTAAFSAIPSGTYVIRSNPLQFDNLTGPSYYMLDATLVKNFKITERVQTELKMAAYNALNRLNRGNPNMDVNSSQFGQALYQGTPSATFGPQTMELGNVSGRQVEFGLKIIF